MGVYPSGLELTLACVEQRASLYNLQEINQAVPRHIKNNLVFHEVIKIFAGFYNVALVTNKGQLLMHGLNTVNQLCCQPDIAAVLEFFPDFKPVDGFPKEARVVDVSIGETHVYAIVVHEGKHRVYGWGKNFLGQLFCAKDGDSVDSPRDLTENIEKALDKDEYVVQASVGGQHTLFATSKDRIFGIGHMGYGQLG